ncbi:hypothetical protein DDE82_006681 [Stemphylium lycopersici]|nr:hypothetical protein DDE82_006681 [Stemphylium lycopersici]
MALTPKTKTSTRTTIAQGTSRPSMQQYQKSAKEKIDETDDFAESDSDSPYTDEDASPEASLPTQNTSDGALEQLMSNMVDDDLLAQKAGIEDAMTKQLVSLQKAYDAHSRDLENVLRRRLEEMK